MGALGGLARGLMLLWGLGIDIVLLFVLPSIGNCGPFDELIKITKCSNALDSILVRYVAASCGIVRTLICFFPNEKGLWFAGMGTMLLDIGVHVQTVSHADAAGNHVLCGVAFVIMLLNIPSSEKAKGL